MAEGSESPGSLMKITVKTPKEKHDLEINVDATVEELKDKVSAKFSAPREQLCLIFAGKILKDADKLSQHGIKNGLTVHLVIKSANRAQEQAAQHSTTSPQSTPTTGGVGGTPGVSPPQPDVGATPFGLGSLGGLAGMGGMGMGSANFMEMQQRMQRELMSNPDMMRQMMENPLVQSMMSNPDVMRQLIMNNPQMRELMERNPEITHMLNNPELMRQTMELARNPAMLQELMRSQDRAMSNLESIPGGFNALQRMYRDIQEPMMNAAQESLGGSNPFAGLVSSSGDSGSQQQGRENSDPLPNPWAPPGSTTTTSTATSGSTPTSTAPGTGQSGAQAAFGMFNSPGMQSLMQQMMQNPQMMQNMMQAPYVQTMLQTMAANPEMAQQVFQSNPIFAGNQQMQELFLQSLPQMSAQLQNPEVQSMVSNPRALNAVMQIQQGLATLQQEAPTLFPRMSGLAGGPPTAATTTPGGTTTTSSTAATTPTTPPTATPTSTAATTTTTATGTAPTPSAGGVPTGPLGTTMGAGPDAFTNMMAQMVQMMVGAQGNPGTANPGANLLSQPPETRYAGQLEQLAAMGFVDRDANIRALTATLGDVNAAIDRLLSQR